MVLHSLHTLGFVLAVIICLVRLCGTGGDASPNIKSSSPPVTSPRIFLCTIAMEEDAYVEEWVRYNLLIGFEHIYIYDNNNYTQPADTMLGNITKSLPSEFPGRVTVVPFPGHRPRPLTAAFTEFAHRFAQEDVYAAFFDVDEFFVLGNFKCVLDLLQAHAFTGRRSLGINWMHFGSNGHMKHENLPVVDRFDKRAPGTNVLVKVIAYCPDVVDFGSAHDVHLRHGKRVYDVHGQPVSYGHIAHRNETAIALHHYAVKSLEEYKQKMHRGSSNPVVRNMAFFVRIDNASTVFDDGAARTVRSHDAATCGILNTTTAGSFASKP